MADGLARTRMPVMQCQRSRRRRRVGRPSCCRGVCGGRREFLRPSTRSISLLLQNTEYLSLIFSDSPASVRYFLNAAPADGRWYNRIFCEPSSLLLPFLFEKAAARVFLEERRAPHVPPCDGSERRGRPRQKGRAKSCSLVELAERISENCKVAVPDYACWTAGSLKAY